MVIGMGGLEHHGVLYLWQRACHGVRGEEALGGGELMEFGVWGWFGAGCRVSGAFFGMGWVPNWQMRAGVLVWLICGGFDSGYLIYS